MGEEMAAKVRLYKSVVELVTGFNTLQTLDFKLDKALSAPCILLLLPGLTLRATSSTVKLTVDRDGHWIKSRPTERFALVCPKILYCVSTTQPGGK
jgi:hypothetical protein